MSTFFKKTKWFVSYFEKYLLVHFLKIFRVISPFLNFQCSTSHFLKKHKISLVLLIEPFLIRTECVYLFKYLFTFRVSQSSFIFPSRLIKGDGISQACKVKAFFMISQDDGTSDRFCAVILICLVIRKR